MDGLKDFCGRRIGRVILSGALVVCAGAVSAAERIDDEPLTIHRWHGAWRMTGSVAARGDTLMTVARRAADSAAQRAGVRSTDLVQNAWPDGRDALPLMIDRATGEAKFHIVRYRQQRGGIAVVGGSMRVLVRAGGARAGVVINADVRDLGAFEPDMRVLADAMGRYAGSTAVIWAGTAEEPAPAREAIEMIGEDRLGLPVLWVVDARTEEILHETPLIYDAVRDAFGDALGDAAGDVAGGAAVTGNVAGVATDGIASAACETESARVLPYVRITTGDNEAFTDAAGAFTLVTADDSITATLGGPWFDISSAQGPSAVVTAAVADGMVEDILFNAANADAFLLAQVNAHLELNRVRDFVLAHHPGFPALDQEGLDVVVNRTDALCPGNAFYNAAEVSINTCAASGNQPNTAWSSILHHEFGHHLVQQSQSGQGRYGEGFSDALAVLMADDPRVGIGFHGVCAPFRNAENDIQWPCNATSSHFCGQILSGCVWQTRLAMERLHPDADAIGVVAELLLASVFLHSGFDVTPAIAIDFLVLDDDDGDLSNGTPHSDAILAGFGMHNMIPIPPPANETCSDALDVMLGVVTGTTAGASAVHGPSCGSLGPDVWLRYVPDEDGELIVESCGSDFDTVLAVYSSCPMPGNGGAEIDCSHHSQFCPAETEGGLVRISVTAGDAYFIRVGGISAQSGAFRLLLRGAPPSFAFPDGDVVLKRQRPPEFFPPGEPIEFTVRIMEGIAAIDPASAKVQFRFDDTQPFQSALLTPVRGEGDLFRARLPLIDCRAEPEIFLEVTDVEGTRVTTPELLTDEPFRAFAGIVTDVLRDTFETDIGWTTEAGGTTTAGFWQRGVPVADPIWPFAATEDSDGSGQCWLTQNEPENTDVDGAETEDGVPIGPGVVTLVSPVIDMSGQVVLTYDYNHWITQNDGLDLLQVQGSSDDITWQKIAGHDRRMSNAWERNRLFRTDMTAQGFFPDATSRIRFIANDTAPASITEAGIDNLSIIRLDCDLMINCPADCTRDGVVNMDDVMAVLSAFGGGFGNCDIEPDNGDGSFGNNQVNVDDLLTVVRGFGPCP